VAVKYIQIHRWRNLAEAQGFEKTAIDREIVAGLMIPAQVAEAQRLVREWTPDGKQSPGRVRAALWIGSIHPHHRSGQLGAAWGSKGCRSRAVTNRPREGPAFRGTLASRCDGWGVAFAVSILELARS
jgi:hypothetical protein